MKTAKTAKTAILWALAAFNAVLLTVVVIRHVPSNQAVAQPTAARPSDYMTIPAHVSVAQDGLVYILDTTNQELGGMSYDSANKTMQILPKIALNPLFNGAGGVVGGGPGKVMPRKP